LLSLSLTKYQAFKAVLTLATDDLTALPLGKKHPGTKLNNQLGCLNSHLVTLEKRQVSCPW